MRLLRSQSRSSLCPLLGFVGATVGGYFAYLTAFGVVERRIGRVRGDNLKRESCWIGYEVLATDRGRLARVGQPAAARPIRATNCHPAAVASSHCRYRGTYGWKKRASLAGGYHA